MNDTVLWHIDGRGVATVTLNRPQVNNAYNGDLIAGLHTAMDGLERERGLRIVVLKGNGRHFQAGADLAWIRAVAAQGPRENREVSRLTAEAICRLDTCPVPTLALIQGGCFGGGTGIAAACDIVVAAENAIFSISETRWGLMAGIILPHLCRAMGVRQVRRYALTGERFDAAEARRIGFVHEVCPVSELEATGQKVVEAVLMNAPAATTATKLRTLSSAGAFLDEGDLRDLVEEHARTRQQAEATEGLASFREKRKPAWYPEQRRNSGDSQEPIA
ncbi:enoyl-CoA hydratase-related protein [Enhydrobacter sp.]|uniref:enoyl-CoA hydratase-related protein n=1 Tax=Enhydrobacter sp. TaxID=1894999 RepID=UPI002630F69C|nr:enoyl-CoA hydratase-related protein [Enhydrobacter sp.]WIM11116.1 MAG: Enoyl-CoA hydratase [Enhydrobacter sp.]